VTGERPIERALLAPYDKAGLARFARDLVEGGTELVASGGTARVLEEAGLPVTRVEDVTGSPEMLGGRVKTLHPRIHGGLLADRRDPDHMRQLEDLDIQPFDLLVGGLYPFRETVARGADLDTVVENIDIGGPAMIRAAAKNHASVTVVVDPRSYPAVIAEIKREGGVSAETRRRLAAEAFAHTAAYDAAIASWFGGPSERSLPPFVGLALEKVGDLRYGENPHQRGALYGEAGGSGPLGGAEVLQGKEMSFNNWLDVHAAYELAGALPEHACVIVKHNNPCGVSVSADQAEAYRRAFEGDSVSAFGGIVAFNAECGGTAAEAMREVFTEVVVAPSFTEGSLRRFAERENLRVVRASLPPPGGWDVRTIPGGALVQDRDAVTETWEDMRVASSRQPSEDERRDLLIAWTIAWRVKSNTIVFVRDAATVGIGAGQMSRVDSSWIAVRKAGDRAKGAVMASDAFFPFPDALEVAADAGVTAVIHPGGSVRDEEVLETAERAGMAVVVTGRRHFRH
jgi:phosphoribosylaminoimidazolecarboxamide formyltransferase/IMP cyclohydrolase